MNKFFIATAIVVALTGSALAHKRPTTTTNGTGALVTEKGVTVKAPVGSDVQVDVDGRDVDVTVDGPDRGLIGLGVLGL